MINIQTVFVIAPLILLVLVGLMLCIYRIEEDKSAKLWVWGCTLLALGFVLAAMRTVNEGELIFALSNSCTFLGVVLTFFAFEKLLTNKDNSIPMAVFAAIGWGFGLAAVLGTQLQPYIALIVGLTLGFIHLYFVRRFLCSVKEPNRYVKVLIAISFLHGFLWLVRGITSLIAEFHLISSQAIPNVAFVLVFIMLSTARQFLYVLMRLAATSDERKQLVELNQEKNKLIGSLLKVNKTVATAAVSATVAHEVNQPLTAIKLTVSTLLDQLRKMDVPKDQLLKELAWIDADTDRAADTIKMLRSIFQEDAVVMERFDVSEIVNFVLELSNYDLKSYGITVVRELEGRCYAECNASEVRQVLVNLVGNAFDALNVSNVKEKRLMVTVRHDADAVVIVVADNGLGVPADKVGSIFELLETNKAHGSGLGLWLCQELMKRNNGSISYQPALNGGAQFTLSLPASV
jgi:signal transduction histidine kinase